MKKFIQISLVLVLAFVLAYAAFAGSVDSTGQAGVNATGSFSSTTSSDEVVLIPGCRSSRSGVPCALPNVGWNS